MRSHHRSRQLVSGPKSPWRLHKQNAWASPCQHRRGAPASLRNFVALWMNSSATQHSARPVACGVHTCPPVVSLQRRADLLHRVAHAAPPLCKVARSAGLVRRDRLARDVRLGPAAIVRASVGRHARRCGASPRRRRTRVDGRPPPRDLTTSTRRVVRRTAAAGCGLPPRRRRGARRGRRRLAGSLPRVGGPPPLVLFVSAGSARGVVG